MAHTFGIVGVVYKLYHPSVCYGGVVPRNTVRRHKGKEKMVIKLDVNTAGLKIL